MPTLREQYLELLTYTQKYLSQEYSSGERIFADQGNYEVFRREAQQRGFRCRSNDTASPPTLPVVAAEPARPSPQAPAAVVAKEPPKKKPSPQKAPPTREKQLPSKEAPAQEIPPPGQRPLVSAPPPPPTDDDGLDDVRGLVTKLFPSLNVIDKVADDAEARRIKDAWKGKIDVPDVIVVAHDDLSASHRAFLFNVARAITLHLAPTKVLTPSEVQRYGGWETVLSATSLKLTLATTRVLEQVPELSQKHSDGHLTGRPLLCLEELDLYFREPERKVTLWQKLKGLLTTNDVVA